MIHIRKASQEDTHDIINMIKELALYERALDEVKLEENELKRNLFGENAKARALIAELQTSPSERQVIGYGIYFYSFSTWLGRAGIYLEDLYIRPNFRGRGAGKAIMSYLAKECERDNLGRLEWACLNWNAPSIAFYESLKANNQSSQWRVYRLEGEALTNLAQKG